MNGRHRDSILFNVHMYVCIFVVLQLCMFAKFPGYTLSLLLLIFACAHSRVSAGGLMATEMYSAAPIYVDYLNKNQDEKTFHWIKVILLF